MSKFGWRIYVCVEKWVSGLICSGLALYLSGSLAEQLVLRGLLLVGVDLMVWIRVLRLCNLEEDVVDLAKPDNLIVSVFSFAQRVFVDYS